MARVEERQGELLQVTLTHNGVNINEELVSQGLLRVAKHTPRRAEKYVKGMREHETTARKTRAGMWRFGDIDEDDDMEFGMRKQQAQAAQAAPAPNAWGKK